MAPGLSLALVSGHLLGTAGVGSALAGIQAQADCEAAEIVAMAVTPPDQWDAMRAHAQTKAREACRLGPDESVPWPELARAFRSLAADIARGDHA